jgi:hypothetical protein
MVLWGVVLVVLILWTLVGLWFVRQLRAADRRQAEWLQHGPSVRSHVPALARKQVAEVVDLADRSTRAA